MRLLNGILTILNSLLIAKIVLWVYLLLIVNGTIQNMNLMENIMATIIIILKKW